MDPPSSRARPTDESPQGSTAPLLGHKAEYHVTDLSTDMGSLSCGPLPPSCIESVFMEPPDPKQPSDVSTASAHQSRVSVERKQKASKKTHHASGGGDGRASGHSKTLQATKASVQKQWVPVHKNGEGVGASVKQIYKEFEEPASSSSSRTSSPSVEACQNQDPDETPPSEEASPSIEVCQNQDPDEIQQSRERLVLMPSSAAETLEHPLPQEHALSDVVSQVADEEQSPFSSAATEDDQTIEPQRSLSRTSSLSAKGKEFVPKSTSASSMGLPAMHGEPVVAPPFPPMSPLPSPGPPPPPPPPIIPPPTHVMHMLTSSLSRILPDPLANQSDKTNLETVEDQYQTQVSDVAMAQVAAAKPVLTEALKAKIVKQVEFYFSDANLPTDHHLMKFVRKDSQGFVPIAVVAHLRKVKNLRKNHVLVADVLRSSNQLVVSEDGKKVRRLHLLPHVEFEEIQGSDNTHLDASSKKGRGRGQGQGQGRGRGHGQYHPNTGRGHPVGTPPQASGLANIEAKRARGPRMPDGTRGFTLGRGKRMAMNPA